MRRKADKYISGWNRGSGGDKDLPPCIIGALILLIFEGCVCKVDFQTQQNFRINDVEMKAKATFWDYNEGNNTKGMSVNYQIIDKFKVTNDYQKYIYASFGTLNDTLPRKLSSSGDLFYLVSDKDVKHSDTLFLFIQDTSILKNPREVKYLVKMVKVKNCKFAKPKLH